ncbi:Maf family protein [Psychrobacter sp. LV10R520-6]|uniref:Maf family protein n=1 Tax=Psychrobacter sp. LV10R520-6 TaxID=1415574 RepID=UPI0024C6F48F|nr:Maf family protein [Psychrobacter sp. LV10R520-6]SNT69110.1 septum formation protein [Psychrobacter sp. LV10R520-6]
MDIILASGSPRRRELLAIAQHNFKVMSVDVDETPYDAEPPKDYIERMIATKANSAIEQLNADFESDKTELSILSIPPNKPFIMLTADTIGVLPDGQTVLIKPTDRNHAYSMWQQMSDNTHQIWTAVQATLVMLTPTNNTNMFKTLWQQQIIERTEVTFVPLTSDMMAGYWNSGEPADKAGGYAIQGLAAAWVTRINGSYTNVVGLPLAQTLALIDEANEVPTN